MQTYAVLTYIYFMLHQCE